MRTKTITLALAAAISMGTAATAVAAPPHGDGGHTHHVHTGDGGCVDVDSVAFFAEDRGLHRGGNASGFEQGVWHGPCH